MYMFKILWGITGTGFVLDESIALMEDLQANYEVKLTVMLSKEGAAVVKWYKKWLKLTQTVSKVSIEKTPNIPFYAGPVQIGNFDFFLVCPVSANSIAKIVYGIADTLITNCVAQAIKGGQKVYIFPSDQDTEPIVTTRPDGSPLVLKIRDIELENIRRLNQLEGIHVISEFSEIKQLVLSAIKKKE
ncbi:MAG: archaeoflavoprotein AfpA [Promethearchaeota archaeon]|nr:MAG: archaeoflavoprotein AfpA [Candidatus Lokiarchaeota archaeon]